MARIAIWSPNYAPEPTGIPPLVTDLAVWLVGRGHEVRVATAVPNYPHRRIYPAYRGTLWTREQVDGVEVRRSWLRVRPEERFVDKALYEASFTAFSLPNALRVMRGADAVLCVVPCLGSAVAAATIMAARRRLGTGPRLVLWIQDLVLRAAASLDAGDRARRLLSSVERVESAAYRAADGVVVCSPGFTEYVRAAGVDERRLRTILNWVDVVRLPATPPDHGRGPVRFLYAGNIGYTQGLETLVDAASGLDGVDVEIVGDGNRADQIRRLASAVANVGMRATVAAEDYPALLSAADVQVVVQRAVGADANLPSKIGSYLASGRPIVASISAKSAGAQLLAESGAAIIVPPEDVSALATAMAELAADPDRRADLGATGRHFAEQHLAREQVLPRFEQFLLEAD